MTFQAPRGDVEYLKRFLGGLLEDRPDGVAITRVVGHVRLPSGTVLRIRSPKATGASLLSWIAYVDPRLRPLRLLGQLDRSTEDGDISTVAAQLFTRGLLAVASRNGLIRSYENSRVRVSTLRGRIDFAELGRRPASLSAMPCLVWERVTDTPLNRFLRAAASCVARDPVMRTACRDELAAVQALLGGVRPEIDFGLLSGSRSLARTEHAYDGVAAVARLILQHTYLRDGDRRPGLAFLVNVETLFEKAVCRAFADAGLEVVPKHAVPYVREAAGRRDARAFQPDLYCSDERIGPFVIDAKYKASVSSANLQQVLAYCFLTGAPRAVLVVPAGGTTQAERYAFTPGSRWAGLDDRRVQVDVLPFDTSGRDVAAWRANGWNMVKALWPDRAAGALNSPRRGSDS